jgi:hypothetical protein
VSASSAKCAGKDLVEGYRAGALDFLALPLFSAIVVISLMRGGGDQGKVQEFLASHNLIAFGFRSVQVTHGMLVVCVSFFGFVLFNALMTKESVTRYFAIATYCHSTAAPR